MIPNQQKTPNEIMISDQRDLGKVSDPGWRGSSRWVSEQTAGECRGIDNPSFAYAYAQVDVLNSEMSGQKYSDRQTTINGQEPTANHARANEATLAQDQDPGAPSWLVCQGPRISCG